MEDLAKPELRKLGGSLSVPSVQELAKETLIEVPPRYVRTEIESILCDDGDRSSFEAPVLDMQRLISQQFMASELEKLHQACQEWGFFQLINHGVSSSLLERVKAEVQKFFDLTKEEKEKYGQLPGDLEGFGQAYVFSDDQKLDWADMFYMVTLPAYLRKPHLFPMLPVALRETMEIYCAELKNVAMELLNLIATAMKIDIADMKTLFEEGLQFIRMNYYPPCPQPEKVIGLTPHSDPVGLTILLQLNEIEGLQIRKDGKWLPIKPTPDAFVVNVGDILEIVTNGAYRSIEHRAVVNSVKKRLSIGTFLSPKLDGDMGPAPSLITPETPARFKTIGVADYFRGMFSRDLDGKSYLEVMRI